MFCQLHLNKAGKLPFKNPVSLEFVVDNGFSQRFHDQHVFFLPSCKNNGHSYSQISPWFSSLCILMCRNPCKYHVLKRKGIVKAKRPTEYFQSRSENPEQVSREAVPMERCLNTTWTCLLCRHLLCRNTEKASNTGLPPVAKLPHPGSGDDKTCNWQILNKLWASCLLWKCTFKMSFTTSMSLLTATLLTRRHHLSPPE